MAENFDPVSTGATFDGALSATLVVGPTLSSATVVGVPVVEVLVLTVSSVVCVAQAAGAMMVAPSQTYLSLNNFISVKAESVLFVRQGIANRVSASTNYC
jgi:hypothetical protein